MAEQQPPMQPQDQPLNITLTPSDVVGAIVRGLGELSLYLNNSPAMNVDAGQCLTHIDHMAELTQTLAQLQHNMMAQAGNANSPEGAAAAG